MEPLNLPTYSFNTKSENGRIYIFDQIRKKFVVLTPEEWVRQNFVMFLIKERGYPESLISFETGLKLNRLQKRTDVLIYNRKGEKVAIIECKASDVKLTTKTFDQILRYNAVLKVPYLMVTNGLTHFCFKIWPVGSKPEFLNFIPDFEALAY